MLDAAQLADTLHALLSESPESALKVIDSADLDPAQQATLQAAVTSSTKPVDQLTAVGRALIATGHGRDDANEAYRAAFYVSAHWHDYLQDPLFTLFTANKAGHLLDKWVHYFPLYTRYFSPFRGKAVRVLEIGVYRGGSMRMWTWFFGPEAKLVGMDVDPVAIECAKDEYSVVLGDQANPEDLRRVNDEYGPFDIIIDDGGHTMEQQITAVETLFPLLAEGGVYLVEDCHTSYWDSYAGGLKRPGTFVEWVKDRIDDLHGYHIPDTDEAVHPVWTQQVSGIHCHDSVVVMDKRGRFAPFAEQSGGGEFIHLGRPATAVISELTATRLSIAAERDRLRAELAEWESLAEDLRHARADVVGLRDFLGDLERDRDDSRSDAELAAAAADQAHEQMRWMRRSASWRLTSPLRAIRRRRL
ncbi:MAG: class I SAM-dependent methyltransferase [Candidatus Phosphoribacter sp.]|nr:class I SAM-dependent methyltransferase [Actinomycetales bacterium]